MSKLNYYFEQLYNPLFEPINVILYVLYNIILQKKKYSEIWTQALETEESLILTFCLYFIAQEVYYHLPMVTVKLILMS